MIALSGGVLSLGLLTAALSGCGGSETTEPTKPIGVSNPSPDNPLKDVSIENEAGQMERIKKQLNKTPGK
jgi:hypothetical protein